MRVYVFCFCCFQHTFVVSKITKTLTEVKNYVFPFSFQQKCLLSPPVLEIHGVTKVSMNNI